MHQSPDVLRKMPTVDIITIAHSPEDGRLIRHQRVLKQNGFDAEIWARQDRGRLSRFTLGPLWVIRHVRRRRPAAVILPDPELHLFVAPIIRRWTKVVCDVHEDYKAASADRRWVRKGIRKPVLGVLAVLARVRTRTADCIIVADHRIDADAVLVTNRPTTADLPAPQPSQGARVVYVGDVRASRGMYTMLDLVAAVPGVSLDIVGPVSSRAEFDSAIGRLGLDQRVTAHGRMSYEDSWTIAVGALAGLSLLSDTPAFRDARPTKIWEYGIVGIPVLASDLPGQSRLLADSGGGVSGEFETLVGTLRTWVAKPDLAAAFGAAGRAFAEEGGDQSAERLVNAIGDLVMTGDARPLA